MVGREGLHRSVLLDIAHAAGCTEVRSHLATGNLTFEARREEVDAVATAMEAGLEDLLGRHELVAVRSLPWVRELVGRDRFLAYDSSQWALEVGFLRHDAAPIDPSRLDDPRRTAIVETRFQEMLTARPRTGGARPHVNSLLERATGGQATSRAWSTLQRLASRPD